MTWSWSFILVNLWVWLISSLITMCWDFFFPSVSFLLSIFCGGFFCLFCFHWGVFAGFVFVSRGFIKLTLKKREGREKFVHMRQCIHWVSIKIWNATGISNICGFFCVGNKLQKKHGSKQRLWHRSRDKYWESTGVSGLSSEASLCPSRM